MEGPRSHLTLPQQRAACSSDKPEAGQTLSEHQGD